MIITIFIGGLIQVFSLIFSNFPVITSLPFGMGTALSTVMGDLQGFLYVMPPFQVVWQCLLWYYSIYFTLFAFRWTIFFVNLIRGSGAKVD